MTHPTSSPGWLQNCPEALTIVQSALQIPQPVRSEVTSQRRNEQGVQRRGGRLCLTASQAPATRDPCPRSPLPAARPLGASGAPAAPRTAAAKSKPHQSLSIPWECKLLTSLRRPCQRKPRIYMSLLSPCERGGAILLCYQ